MFTLTHTAPQAIIQPVAHIGGTGLVSRNLGVKMRRFIAVFFCANLYPPSYGGVIKALERVAGPKSGRPTLFTLPPLIGLFVGRLKTCYLGQNQMNTSTPIGKSAQNPQTKTVSLFNVFFHRQIIAQGINGNAALRLKSYYPACIIKFSSFGGAL